MRWTGETSTGRLLGVQLLGRLGSETAKRVDVAATAIHCGLSVDEISDLDLTYTPTRFPVGRDAGRRPGLGAGPVVTLTGARAE